MKVVHDTISNAVYGGLGRATRLGGRALEGVVGRRYTQLLSDTPRGAAGIAIINGLIGDTLAAERNELAKPMAITVRGTATPRIAVFLHGLMETEFSWGRRPNYGSRLADDAAGRPCTSATTPASASRRTAASFPRLLERAVADWPVEVGEIALIGHSMGGLVARSAAHQAIESGAEWVRNVSHVVSLGTPHRGAPLEEIVHVGSAALDLLPETRGMSRFLRRRSGGIRDLRRGSLVDDDWKDHDPDALRAVACKEIPLLDGAKHCFVSCSGDLLVLGSSAAPWRGEECFRVGGGHFALLNHPQVYDRLRDWLA